MSKADNLFDIVKRVIIGQETVSFSVISIITDNKTIKKKAISFFWRPVKPSVVYTNTVVRSRPLFLIFDTEMH